jgi:alpha-L-fucosidase
MGRKDAPEWWRQQYFNRVKDLLDQHQPDLLYTDGGIVYEGLGLGTVAEEYNVGPVSHGETEEHLLQQDAQRLRRRAPACWTASAPSPTSSAPCHGRRTPASATGTTSWARSTRRPKKVIDMLVDIVSKNGNLLLNFPLPASGELDPDERKVLAGITEWMEQNGEGIFSTRPWKVNGEGPHAEAGCGHLRRRLPSQ